LLLGGGLVAGALYHVLRVPTLPLPAGVEQRTERLALAGRVVAVDCYWPRGANAAPVVLLAHGLGRSRKTMAGWGTLLAVEGFWAVAPDLPTWADHARNGTAVAALLATVQSGRLFARPKPAGRAALVGFSAGGQATLLAAAGNTNVACWVGLDPVALGARAGRAAAALHIPAAVLRAEPAAWNAGGNARAIFAALPGPAFTLIVNGATHADAEHPTSRAARWACGGSEPARREVFGHFLLASLKAALVDDEIALRQLWAATNDARVREVRFRQPEAWARPW